jgi:hypothetical protein
MYQRALIGAATSPGVQPCGPVPIIGRSGEKKFSSRTSSPFPLQPLASSNLHFFFFSLLLLKSDLSVTSHLFSGHAGITAIILTIASQIIIQNVVPLRTNEIH